MIVMAVFLVLRQVDWKKRAIKWVGNDPKRAVLYIQTGVEIQKVYGRRTYVADDGSTYAYRHLDINREVVLPMNFPVRWIDGKLMIGLKDGMLIASPMGFHGELVKDDGKVIANYPEMPITSFYKSRLAVQMFQSLSGPSMSMWMMLAVVGAIGIVGYFGMQFLGGGEVVDAVPTPTGIEFEPPSENPRLDGLENTP